MVERRVGQHRADHRIAGRDAAASDSRLAGGRSTIGRSRRREKRGFARRPTRALRLDRGERREHHRERLLLARACAPAGAARPPRSRASTIRWKPPSPFTATIAPSRMAATACSSASSRAARTAPCSVPERELRSAVRTGIRLGMEAAVGGIPVFGAAGRAHGEAAHRGARAVVGQVLDDRIARAAMACS